MGDAAKEGIFLDKACEELPPNPLEHDVGRPTPAPRPSAPAPAPAPRTPAKVQWQEEDTVRCVPAPLVSVVLGEGRE